MPTKTYFAQTVSKSALDPQSAELLTRDCARYNTMLPAALQIHLKHSPGDKLSAFVQVRKRFPDETYQKEYGLDPVVKDGLTLVATNPIAHGLDADVKELINASKASLTLHIEEVKHQISQIEKKAQKEEKILANLLKMKEDLISRSKARKAGEAKLPPFHNRDRKMLRVKNRKGVLTITVQGNPNRSRKRAPLQPRVYENEYDFETGYLTPRIAAQKKKIRQIRARLNDLKQVLGGLRRDLKEGRFHICLGGKATFHKQWNTPTAQSDRKKCRGGRNPRPHDRRKGRDRKVTDPQERKGPYPALVNYVRRERELMNHKPPPEDDARYHEQWLAEFRKKRNRQMFLVGCAARPSGNDVVRYDVRTRELIYTSTERAPAQEESCEADPTAKKKVGRPKIEYREARIPNVLFRYGQELIDASVTADYRKALSPEMRSVPEFDEQYYSSNWDPVPVTWAIQDLGKAFRITCTIQIPAEAPAIRGVKSGCIGIDMNWDNLTVAETDPEGNLLLPPTFNLDGDGNPLLPEWLSDADRQHIQLEKFKERKTEKIRVRMKRTIPIRMEHRSSEQIESDISAALEHVFLWARLQGKPVGMEDIEKLEKDTLYQSKRRNRRVSMFSYNKITELADSKSRKYLVEVRKVNPAFTSQIAKFKYMRQFGLSIHECAAYTIARRTMNLGDPVPEEMLLLIPEKTREKHEWSQWNYLLRNLKDIPVEKFYRKIPYRELKKISAVRTFLTEENQQKTIA